MIAESFHPVLQGFLATVFTWGMTALGASLVFFTVKVNQKLMDVFYGIAAGVMISASCFGLIIPSVAIAETQNWSHKVAWLPAALGFLLGVVFLVAIEKIFFSHDHSHGDTNTNTDTKTDLTTPSSTRGVGVDAEIQTDDSHFSNVNIGINAILREEVKTISYIERGNRQKEDIEKSSDQSLAAAADKDYDDPVIDGVTVQDKKTWLRNLCWGKQVSESKRWRSIFMLVTAITLHNFPEGLAVGVAFGAIRSSADPKSAFTNAIGLALGIGIQNFPEGLGVSMPLRREGVSRMRSFVWGQFSGVVEIVGGIIGAGLVLIINPILPWMLAFAAGSMMYVVIQELIPESHRSGNRTLATMGTVLGFVVMMVLDIALG